MKTLLSLIFTAIFWCASQCNAARNISLPFYESFNTNAYQNDLIWVTHGATHTWLPNGGWNGGGAKFTPCTADGYSGLGQFTNLVASNTTKLNIRFMVFYGTTYQEFGANSKWVMTVRQNNTLPRPMAFDMEYNATEPHFVGYGACSGTVCKYDNNEYGGYWVQSTDRFKIGNRASGLREGEWFSYEFEADLSAGTIKIYLHTADRVFNGLYVQQTTEPGSIFNYIDLIGGFFNDPSTPDANNYYIIDELVIDTNYIGPPAAFVDGGIAPPTTPVLNIQN